MRPIALALALFALGCAHSTGTGTKTQWPPPAHWLAVTPFSGVRQKHNDDCGEAALAAVLRHWRLPPATVANPATARSLRATARARGLDAFVVAGTETDLRTELLAQRPSVIGVMKRDGNRGIGHYEVMVAMDPATRDVITFDPRLGFRKNSSSGFQREWSDAQNVLIVFLPAPASGG